MERCCLVFNFLQAAKVNYLFFWVNYFLHHLIVKYSHVNWNNETLMLFLTILACGVKLSSEYLLLVWEIIVVLLQIQLAAHDLAQSNLHCWPISESSG